ncbi:multisubunit sodium/proton antiporter, MrpC subunit [Desulfocicer vacuolatum DSM 3385]|uniref:Multisubunit sodium/proton antiporter, MrpC subunit n=1 Tax=Desulfocicer vacuolatum DSM 3385 TaxID=1121400 RepID=A0A1W1Z0N2_9BACT|nr:cation:proton antiporter subunit C [Desulfocicer vacuolatum]SMC42027.1 multisubunit sodium/proton antiporter, MrpC subunit [Desulfocicer vacuolatum DSM 3385]
MESIFSLVLAKANYAAYIILMMIGLYAMIAKNNLIKKIVGMSIFQTAVILFYVSIGCKKGATIPILRHHGHPEPVGHAAENAGAHAMDAAHGAEKVVAHAVDAAHNAVHVADYINPLPHVLMLTAIVVGVATLGVALALAIRVYNTYGTLEEDEINQQLRSG